MFCLFIQVFTCISISQGVTVSVPTHQSAHRLLKSLEYDESVSPGLEELFDDEQDESESQEREEFSDDEDEESEESDSWLHVAILVPATVAFFLYFMVKRK